MNVYSEVKEIIIETINNKFKNIDKSLLEKITCERPKDSKYGDVSSNVVLIILKNTQLKVDDLAKNLIIDLKKNSLFKDIQFQKPGFINMKIEEGYWLRLLEYIWKNQKKFGFKDVGKGRKINVEFVSANPTGPLHIGHVRGAVFGDVLSNLLKKNGYNVTKEYYVNDLGNQIENLLNTVRFHIENYKNNTNLELEKDMYQGVYLKELAIDIFKKHSDILESQNESLFREIVLASNINLIKQDLKRLGVLFDKFSSEKKLHEDGIVEKTIKLLKTKNLIYNGKLEKPKGNEDKEWSAKEQTLFKSKSFGDNDDRALKKHDGSWTYFASDIAYHYDKAKRGFEEIINIWGADHAGYIKRVSSAIQAFDFDNLKFSVKLCQIVNIIDNRKVIKMSKRAGNFILLSEVLDGIGSAALRFFMLIRKNDAHLDFDLEKCLDETRENPIFYVQYANARISSVKRLMKQKNLLIKERNPILINYIKSDEEMKIIKSLSTWPKVMEAAVLYREPHRLVFYLIELASQLHSFWNIGKSNSQYKIISEENINLTNARLILLEAVQSILKNGLDILSIKPVDKM